MVLKKGKGYGVDFLKTTLGGIDLRGGRPSPFAP